MSTRLLAVRIAEMPEPAVPSVRESCSTCAAPVWIEKHNRARFPELPICCYECLAQLMPPTKGSQS